MNNSSPNSSGASSSGSLSSKDLSSKAVPSKALTPSCLWHATPELLVQLQSQFGDPFDTYVNGSQVWFRDDDAKDITIEYRLHPVASYKRPKELSTETVLSTITFAIANADETPVPLDTLWGGLEAYVTFGKSLSVNELAEHATNDLGIKPDTFGLVDHKSVGDSWESSQGAVSIADLLFAQLRDK